MLDAEIKTSCEKAPSTSDKNVKQKKSLPNPSGSVEALQALQLLVKDIANIQDPKEASDARKECYDFYRKILDQMEPAETLRIRENSKRVISLNERYERKYRSIYIATVASAIMVLSVTLGRLGDTILPGVVDVMVPVLGVLVASLGMTSIIFSSDRRGKK